MRAAWQTLMARLRRLALVEDGVAAVEFALILPIMLLVYIGSVEASALISMDRRVQSVAGTVGDLVARADGSIASATLTDYFRAASGVMTPYSAAALEQTVTQVRVRPNGTASVVWSRQYVNGVHGSGTKYAQNATFALPSAVVNVARDDTDDTFVIVAESTYSYLPLYGIVFNNPVQLYRENFFMPRFGGSIAFN